MSSSRGPSSAESWHRQTRRYNDWLDVRELPLVQRCPAMPANRYRWVGQRLPNPGSQGDPCKAVTALGRRWPGPRIGWILKSLTRTNTLSPCGQDLPPMTKPLGKGYMRRDGRGSLTSPGSLKMALGLTGLALSRSIFGVHDGFHLISHECCAIRHVLQLGPP